MSDKSNKYGYVGVDIPAQSFGSNKGVFNPAEINDLVANNQWTTFGQLELIETKTASASSAVNFVDIKENIYNVHFLTYSLIPSADDTGVIRFSNNNGTSWIASSYQYTQQFGNSAGAFSNLDATSINFLARLGNSTGTGTNELTAGYYYFYNLGDSTKKNFATMHTTGTDTSSNYQMTFGSAVYSVAEIVNGISLFCYSGNTLTGTASLYGIRYS